MDNIKRVILKLSGEALAKKEGGYNDELIENIANQVKTIVDKGTDVGVVIGGVEHAGHERLQGEAEPVCWQRKVCIGGFLGFMVRTLPHGNA